MTWSSLKACMVLNTHLQGKVPGESPRFCDPSATPTCLLSRLLETASLFTAISAVVMWLQPSKICGICENLGALLFIGKCMNSLWEQPVVSSSKNNWHCKRVKRWWGIISLFAELAFPFGSVWLYRRMWYLKLRGGHWGCESHPYSLPMNGLCWQAKRSGTMCIKKGKTFIKARQSLTYLWKGFLWKFVLHSNSKRINSSEWQHYKNKFYRGLCD